MVVGSVGGDDVVNVVKWRDDYDYERMKNYEVGGKHSIWAWSAGEPAGQYEKLGESSNVFLRSQIELSSTSRH